MTTATKITYRRPPLYPKQKAALFDSARYSVIEASTKSGKTYAALVWLTEQAMTGRVGRNYWWIAPIFAQTKIAYRRLKRALPQSVFRANETDLTLTLANETVIWFKSAEHPDALYGEDVYAAVVDEATRCREESWHALRTTLTATQGPVRIIGNVKGRKNWAYLLARRAEAQEPNMGYHKITWQDAVAAGILRSEEIEDARRQLPASVFGELYEAEAAEDAGNPFGIEAIRACIHPLVDSDPAVWGWDLAKSVDWTVGIALNADGHTCTFDRFQSPWQETIARIQQQTRSCRAYVDSTGVGDPILETLQRAGGNYEGYHFTQPSKQRLMEGLAVAIQRKEIGFPQGPIVNELEAFEYVYSRTGVHYAAMEGMHDDCVCALALAVHGQASGAPFWVWMGDETEDKRAEPVIPEGEVVPQNIEYD